MPKDSGSRSAPMGISGPDKPGTGEGKRGIFWYLALAAAVLPAFCAFGFVHLNGVNVVFWDELELPEFLAKVADHQSTWGEWFAQHNEHRLFFPRMIFAALTSLTGLNSKAAMFLVLGLFLVNLAVLYAVFRRQAGGPARNGWFVPLATT